MQGDGLGTQADWFRGLRAVKAPKDKAAVDGAFARHFCLIRSDAENKLTEEQRKKRDDLEHAVLTYREKKSKLPEDEYYRGLEKLLLDLARVYEINLPSAPSNTVKPN